MNRILLTAVIVCLIAAAEGTATASLDSAPLFAANERTLDLYGTLTDDGHLGVGVGANYFFTRFLGAGLETRVEEFDWPNQISGSVFFRYPVEKWRLAPYVYAGLGREFHDVPQWLYHIGIGADYRLKPGFGLFGDVRETFPGTSSDFAMWRFGVRFRF
jgi:hypothetical protein